MTAVDVIIVVHVFNSVINEGSGSAIHHMSTWPSISLFKNGE